ncbi:hypothetical protein [Acetobacter malorum]|nr:hypothetical protein [Acetobacter malorum]
MTRSACAEEFTVKTPALKPTKAKAQRKNGRRIIKKYPTSVCLFLDYTAL